MKMYTIAEEKSIDTIVIRHTSTQLYKFCLLISKYRNSILSLSSDIDVCWTGGY